MKLLQFCTTPIVNSAGGVGKVFCEMSNRLNEKYTVLDICNDEENGKPYYYLNENIKFLNLQVSKKVPFFVKMYTEVVRFLRRLGCKKDLPKDLYLIKKVSKIMKCLVSEENIDIAICYDIKALTVIDKIGFPLDKCVLMIHSSGESFLDSCSQLELDVMRKVRYIQVLSESAMNLFLQSGFHNTVRIGNVVASSRRIASKEKCDIIVYVAALDKKVKRQYILIEAFEKLHKKYEKWEVKLYGGVRSPKNYDKELQELITNLKLNNKVFLMGKNKDIENELEKCKICAFPSIGEGFSLALTEAMACGLPSIGFKSAPSVNELIKDGHNGILCDDSVDSFAKALEELICDEEKRARYGKNAIEDMKEYSPDIIYKQWEDLLESMV